MQRVQTDFATEFLFIASIFFSLFFCCCLIRTMGVRTENTLNSLRSLVPISISMMNLFIVDKQYPFALQSNMAANSEITFTESKMVSIYLASFSLVWRFRCRFIITSDRFRWSAPQHWTVRFCTLELYRDIKWKSWLRDSPGQFNHFCVLVLGKSSIVFEFIHTRTHWTKWFSIEILGNSPCAQNYPFGWHRVDRR